MLVCTQIPWKSYYNAKSDWADLGGDPGLCTSIQLPGDGKAVGSGPCSEDYHAADIFCLFHTHSLLKEMQQKP